MSAEYGWHDEVILEIPLRRLRQLTAAILMRRDAEQLVARRMVSWQTRVIASFIAATVRTEKGKANPMMDAAQKLAMDRDEATDLAAAVEETVEASKEPEPGSYERFMARFGRVMHRPE